MCQSQHLFQGLSPRVRGNRRLHALAAPPQFDKGADRLAVVDLDVESHVLVFLPSPGRLGNPLSR